MSDEIGGNGLENGGAGNAGDGTVGAGSTLYFDPSSIGGRTSGDAGGGSVDGGDGPLSGDAPVRRGRGRPRGSGRGGKSSNGRQASENLEPDNRVPLQADGIAAILLSMHTMLASFTSVPELEIQLDEANKMGAAIEQVSRQYNVKATEKTLAWTNLATTAAMVYGTRVFAYRMRKTMEADAKKNASGNVQPHPVMMQNR